MNKPTLGALFEGMVDHLHNDPPSSEPVVRKGDDLPTMGQEAENALAGWRCTCGQPENEGVMHRVDGPCYVPEREYAKLQPGQKPMSEEDWEINKDCDLKKRDHHWRWKLDISTGRPSMDHGVCSHCGREAIMKESGIVVLPREP